MWLSLRITGNTNLTTLRFLFWVFIIYRFYSFIRVGSYHYPTVHIKILKFQCSLIIRSIDSEVSLQSWFCSIYTVGTLQYLHSWDSTVSLHYIVNSIASTLYRVSTQARQYTYLVYFLEFRCNSFTQFRFQEVSLINKIFHVKYPKTCQ